MRVEIGRLDDGAARVTIAGARYVSMAATHYPTGRYSELYLHLTGEQCCDLCNALRALRDADHEEALRERAARENHVVVITTETIDQLAGQLMGGAE